MTRHGRLEIEVLVTGPFAENTIIAADADTGRAVLFDPGDEAERILARVRELGVDIERIVCTHAHLDHVGAVAPLSRMLGVKFYLHPDEQPLLDNLELSARMFGLQPPETPTVDAPLAHGDEVPVGELRGRVRLTPGHSPGGCAIYFADQKVVIVGDALFAGSIGRTDLPGGNLQQLLDAIREQLLSLDDDTVVYPGHGPATTIGEERAHNPFLQPGFGR
ncbi:MAG: MBL fold metallo-hydrolase [Myxococcales bacterium]|nr:MBL fold metallo-hydrolase [Myxococcales bacterium]